MFGFHLFSHVGSGARHTFALNEKAELLQKIQGLEKQLPGHPSGKPCQAPYPPKSGFHLPTKNVDNHDILVLGHGLVHDRVTNRPRRTGVYWSKWTSKFRKVSVQDEVQEEGQVRNLCPQLSEARGQRP